MDSKLEREVDVEGVADMVVRGEGASTARQAHALPETTRQQRSKGCRRSHAVRPRSPKVEQFDDLNSKSSHSVTPSYLRSKRDSSSWVLNVGR